MKTLTHTHWSAPVRNPLSKGLVVFLFFLARFPVWSQAQQDALQLRDAIQVTLKNHPSSTIARNNAVIAGHKVTEARASFLPSVNASTNVDYNIKLQTSVIPAGVFGDTQTRLQMGNKFSTGALIQADLNLIDRSSRLNVQSVKVDKDIADLNVLKENETLIYNTGVAYYEVLSLAQKAKLLKENENQNQQLLSILKLRFEQGVAKKSEYDRARVNLNNTQSELAMNQNRYELALNKLKNAMGVDLSAKVTVIDTINYAVPSQAPQITGMNSSQLLSYQIDQKNVLLKQYDIRKKQAVYLPTLAIYAKYGANAYGSEFSSAFNHWFDYSALGVKLSIPIFNGFKRNSQLAQSRISEQNQLLTEKLNMNTYNLDYQNASTEYTNSYRTLINNKENLELAREVVDATTIEYREGTTDLSSLLDADASYKEAQTNYITSLLDFLTSQLSFEKSRGTLTQYISNL
jgi:outer membrane protein